MYIENYDKSDIEKLVVGRRIIAVKEGEEGKILLDNGTELQFENDHECCSWFSTNVVEGELTDNVITGVSVYAKKDSHDPEVQYTIHILSQNTIVSSLEVEGDTGTGYYLSGATLKVNKVSVADQVRNGNTFNLPFKTMLKLAEES